MSKYFNIAREVAKNSQCERDQVGAVIIKDGRVVSVGWNQRVHFGECVRQKHDIPSGSCNELACCWHAEAHAVRQAMFAERSVADGEIYVTREPCDLCRRLLVEYGISKIHYAAELSDQQSEIELDDEKGDGNE